MKTKIAFLLLFLAANLGLVTSAHAFELSCDRKEEFCHGDNCHTENYSTKISVLNGQITIEGTDPAYVLPQISLHKVGNVSFQRALSASGELHDFVDPEKEYDVYTNGNNQYSLKVFMGTEFETTAKKSGQVIFVRGHRNSTGFYTDFNLPLNCSKE